jgi:crossover junction endodeoxyribonuclease RuvC
MSAAIYIGVDIGNVGAIAEIDASGALIAVHDLPTLRDGPNSRPAVNAPLLADIAFKSHASHAYVEFVGARPGEGAAGAFAFGRSRGVIEGVLGAAGVPLTLLTPASWKRTIGIPPGREGAKDLARSEAIRRWPGQAQLFARSKDDGRAEAALIAVAGLMRAGALR